MHSKNRTLITFICVTVLIFFSLIIIVVTTNYTCISKVYTENRYRKDNGLNLLSGLASTFNAWGNDIDTSNSYYKSKECFDNFGPYNSVSTGVNINEASKNNIILDNKMIKINSNIILINQCIILKDVKVLYLTYNTFFSDAKKTFKISLIDNMNNIIADAPSFTDIKTGLMLRNYENYFWGIDFDKYKMITLHIEVYSEEGNFLYDYDHLLFKNHF